MSKQKITKQEFEELGKIMGEKEVLERYEEDLPEVSELKKSKFELLKFSKKVVVVFLTALLLIGCIGYGIYTFMQYSKDFDNTKISLSKSEQENKNLQKTIAEKESKISENENKIKELGEKIAKLETEISTKTSELSEKSSSLKLAEDKKAELEKSKADLEKAKKSAEIDAKNSNLAKQKAQNQAEATEDEAIKLLKIKDVQTCIFGNLANTNFSYTCTLGLQSISCTGGTYAISHNCNYGGNFYSCQVSTYYKSVSNCR